MYYQYRILPIFINLGIDFINLWDKITLLGKLDFIIIYMSL